MPRAAETIQKREVVLKSRMKNDTAIRRTEALSFGPFSLPIHSSPDVGGSLRRTGTTRKVVVFESTSDPVLGHAIGKSGDTEAM
jgi:hypothetical protein